MAYLLDRGRAYRGADVVAVVNLRRRRTRSRVVLRDNSWHHTLTRPVAWRRKNTADLRGWPAVWTRSE